MITAKHHINFDFVVDPALFNLQLEADVDEHHSVIFYTVKNIRVAGRDTGPVLPDISIQKRKECWVHTDSGKESQLSQAAGQAIDGLKLSPQEITRTSQI